MGETRLPIRIACSGMGDRDVFLVRSLLRILDSRHGRQPWSFQTEGSADVIITPSVHKESDQARLAVRRTPSSRFILTVPSGVKVDLSSGMQAVHYPLRASELLDCFDRLESEWPFEPFSETMGAVVRQTEASAIEPRLSQPALLDDPRLSQVPNSQHLSLAPAIGPRTSQLALLDDPRLSQVPNSQHLSLAPAIGSRPSQSALLDDPRLSQVPDSQYLSQAPADSSLSPMPNNHLLQTPTNLKLSQAPIDPRMSQIPEGRVLSLNTSKASGRGVLAHSATIGALMQALRSLRSSQEGERPQGRCIDIFDQLGWIGRLYNGRNKVYASRRFMLDRSAEPSGGRLFQWKFALSGLPPLTKGDALIEVDLDLLAWQFSTRFCYSFANLDLPINVLLHLRRWPDFGIRPEFSSRPGVMLATALLTRQTLSLAMLLRESETSEADLSCLLGVAWLSGWLRCERQMPSSRAQKAPTEKTGFSAIVRSLRKVLGLSRR
ncbi:MAG: hypothetical protein LBP90_00875 [Burkholderiales bacterium]|jgi:hypothetical protein|nr:hypothetical protein [Burkholderiales bacterium]